MNSNKNNNKRSAAKIVPKEIKRQTKLFSDQQRNLDSDELIVEYWIRNLTSCHSRNWTEDRKSLVEDKLKLFAEIKSLIEKSKKHFRRLYFHIKQTPKRNKLLKKCSVLYEAVEFKKSSLNSWARDNKRNCSKYHEVNLLHCIICQQI